MHILRLLSSVLIALCLAALAWWILSVYTPVASIDIPDVTTRFSGENAMQYLHVLTHQYRGRIVGSEQGFASAEYVAGIFRSFGLQIETQDFREAGTSSPDGSVRGWYEGRNVLGILPGQGTGIVVLTAHRDCVPEAPEGAYDNGSGTAVVMELARVMSGGGPHRYTHVFAALDGEEAGLAGARALMYDRPDMLSDIRLMINLDMVGLNGTQGLGVTHTQYLPPKTRSLVASHFGNPYYRLFQAPAGRGSDAQLFVWRGLPTLDFFDQLQSGTRYGHHSAEDTYEQITPDSIQLAGRIVERLILEGDAIGAFTPAAGLMVSNQSGVLSAWRYRLGGLLILSICALPFVFRFHRTVKFSRPTWILAAYVFIVGMLTAISGHWSGSAAFFIFPFLGTTAILILFAFAVRRDKIVNPRLGHLLVAATPALLFAGTWQLIGFWSLGFWTAAIAYIPAVLLTWKAGWAWRLMDVLITLPMVLVTWLIGAGAWLMAPLHAFPSNKLPSFASLYTAAALIGIWAIFGRRPSGRLYREAINSQNSDYGLNP